MSAIPVREHHARGNARGEPRVALVSFDSLGDSLIWLMAAVERLLAEADNDV
jgi:hypothetical protein